MQRISYIDKLRGFAILLVVMGHITQLSLDIKESPFNYFYNSFHVPLFIFISGFLAANSINKLHIKEVSEICLFIKKKAVRLILPFIIVGGIYSLLCFHDFSVIYPGSFGYWYLPSLFYCFIVEILVGGAILFKKSWISDIIIHIFVYLILVTIYYGLNPSIPYYLWFIKMYPFFLFGIFCKRYLLVNNFIFDNRLCFTLSCLLYIILLPIVDIIHMPIAGFFAVVICVQIFKSFDEKIPSIFSILGQSSLAIYVFHYFLLPGKLSIGKSIISVLYPSELLNNGNFVITACMSFILSLPVVFLCIVLEKIIKLSKWINLIVFGTK